MDHNKHSGSQTGMLLVLMNLYGEQGIRFHYGLKFLDYFATGLMILTMLCNILLFLAPNKWIFYCGVVILNGSCFYIIRRVFKSICNFIEEIIETQKLNERSLKASGEPNA